MMNRILDGAGLDPDMADIFVLSRLASQICHNMHKNMHYIGTIYR